MIKQHLPNKEEWEMAGVNRFPGRRNNLGGGFAGRPGAGITPESPLAALLLKAPLSATLLLTKLLLTALILTTLLLAAGCSGSKLQPTGGGLAVTDAARLSMIVAQTRAQFPALSGSKLPYNRRKTPAAVKGGAGQGLQPEPVLHGTGTAISPGVQAGKTTHIQLILHLSKPEYDSGFLMLSGKEGKQERRQIVAFDKRGNADKVFEFQYVLADPQGKLSYLAVLGGTYKGEGGEFLGFEGTLIEAGADADIEKWRKGYKIDFGYNFPVEPEYRAMVAQAEELFRQLVRRMREAESLQRKITPLEKEAAELKAVRPKEGEEAQQASAVADKVARAAELQGRLKGELTRAEADILHYYELRGKIAQAYSRFYESNHYTWQETGVQQAFYDGWKPVELHHPRIDKLTKLLLAMLEKPEALKAGQKAALEKVEHYDNWSKNPTEAK